VRYSRIVIKESTMKNVIFESWWTDNLIELVQDTSKKWSKKVFKPTPGIWIPTEQGRLLEKYEEGMEIPAGGKLDPRAWDHEHCELCHEIISDVDIQNEGYVNQDDQWVCEECYQKYIIPNLNESTNG
jgi:hypothetical protein